MCDKIDPMISVVMATYNGQKYIKEQLDSILSQSLKVDEIIISDDGSTDGTLAILDDYALRYSFIRVIRNTGKHGFVSNFANALSFCHGDYIALCDQDDIWCEDHIKDLYDNIGDNYIIGANALFINEDGSSKNLAMRDYLGVSLLPQDNKDFFRSIIYTNVFQGTACMITREFLQKAMPFPDSTIFHDHYLAIMAASYNKAVYLDKVVLLYRQHDSSITNSKKSLAYRITRLFDRKETIEKTSDYVKFLTDIKSKDIKEEYKELIDKCIAFYINIIKGKRLATLRYFIKNYETIRMAPKNTFFIKRLIKILVFLKY